MKAAQIIAVLCACLLGTAGDAAQLIEKTFPAGPIRTVVLEHGAGDVEIVAGAPGVISIQTLALPGNVACGTTAETSGRTLTIATQATGTLPAKCMTHLKLTVPKSMAIEARVGIGVVDLRNIAGKLDLNLGAGAVTGHVDLKTTKIVVADGPVTLTWLNEPPRGSIDFKVARGDVTLRFPKGSMVDSDITPGLAGFSSVVPLDASAPFKISGTVGAGNIAIRH